MLQVLLDDPEGQAAKLIAAAGGDARQARAGIEAELAKLPRVEGAGAGQVYMAPELAACSSRPSSSRRTRAIRSSPPRSHLVRLSGIG